MTENRDDYKDGLQKPLHIVASATHRGGGVGGGVGGHMGPFLGGWGGGGGGGVQEMKVWKLMSMYSTVLCGMQQAQL